MLPRQPGLRSVLMARWRWPSPTPACQTPCAALTMLGQHCWSGVRYQLAFLPLGSRTTTGGSSGSLPPTSAVAAACRGRSCQAACDMVQTEGPKWRPPAATQCCLTGTPCSNNCGIVTSVSTHRAHAAL